jgi:3-methyladenine DNA glycosylase AlkD
MRYPFSSRQDGVNKKQVMTLEQIVGNLKTLANPDNVAGMARYGISTEGCFGVPMPFLRKMAGEIGRRHNLSDGLWRSGVHEARILAGLIDDPSLVTDEQMERWVPPGKSGKWIPDWPAGSPPTPSGN